MKSSHTLSLSYITDRIVLLLKGNEIIKPEEEELYLYGVRQLIFWTINLVTIIALGLFFRVLLQLTVFVAAYFSLRTYSGGYHAKTEIKCYISSIFMLSAVIAAIKNIPSGSIIWLLLTAIAVFVVFALAPIDNENKRFDDVEAKHYRKRTIIILLIETAAIAITYYTGFTVVSACLSLALVTNGIMITLGFIENKKGKQNSAKETAIVKQLY